MLPTALPSLLPPTLGAAGVVTPAGSTGIDFAALLPAGVVPIMPRQRDGEGGNILPVEPGKADEQGGPEGPNVWVTPPLWLVTCPPPTHAGTGEAPLNPLPRFVAPAGVSAPPPEIAPPADVSAGVGPVAAADPYHKTATEAPGMPTRIDRAEAGGEAPQATLPSVALQELGVSFPAPSPDGLGAVLDGEPGEVAQRSAADPVATPPRQDLGVTVPIASLPQTSPASPAEGRRGIDSFPAPPFGALVADVATPQLPQSPSTLRTGEGSTPLPHLAPSSPDALSLPPEVSTQAPPQRVAEDAAAKVPSDLPGQDRLPTQAVSARTNRIATPLAVEPDIDLPSASPVAARAGTLLPPVPPAPPALVAPAAQIFAAAIHRAVRDEGQLESATAWSGGIALAAADAGASAAVATIDSSRQGALDLGRETWPAKMIERIEMIRDAMDVVDTSIRLVPDKLGAIDVSLRTDGDAIAVHFTAQQAETRQLLADAQPRLAELAQEKGLKLAMQAGNDPGPQHHQQQQRAPAPAPLSTHRQGRPASHGDVAAADERIA